MDGAHGAAVPLRVLLVEPQALVRAGLAAELGAVADVEIIGICADPERAVEHARAERPDVVVADATPGSIDARGLTGRLVAEAHAGVVVVLDRVRPRLSRRLLRSGARGIVDTRAGPAHLARAVRAAAAGGAYLCPHSAAALTSGLRRLVPGGLPG